MDCFDRRTPATITKFLLLLDLAQFLDILPIYMIFLGPYFPLLLLLLRCWLPLPLIMSGGLYLLKTCGSVGSCTVTRTTRRGSQIPSPGSSSSLSAQLPDTRRSVRQRLPLNSAWLGKPAVLVATCNRDIINVFGLIQGASDNLRVCGCSSLLASRRGQSQSGTTPPGQLLGSRHSERGGARHQIPAPPSSPIDYPVWPAFAADIFSLGNTLVSGHIVLTSIPADVPMQLAIRPRRHPADDRNRATARALQGEPRRGGAARRLHGIEQRPSWREGDLEGSKPHVTRLFCFFTLRRLIKDGALKTSAPGGSEPSLASARGQIARWFNDVCVMSAHPSKAEKTRTSVDVSKAP